MTKLPEGVIAGIAAGLASGIAARVAMRMVADGVADGIGQLPAFTPEGSAAILASGAIAGAPLGAIYAAAEPSLRAPARARGLVFGLVLLASAGPLFLSGDELFSRGRVALFALLFPIFGIVVGLALPPARRIAPRIGANAHVLLALIALGGGAVVGAGLIGLAAQAVKEHGAAALAAIAPLLVATGLLARPLRARRIGAQASR